jgi:hypothetical protein
MTEDKVNKELRRFWSETRLLLVGLEPPLEVEAERRRS